MSPRSCDKDLFLNIHINLRNLATISVILPYCLRLFRVLNHLLTKRDIVVHVTAIFVYKNRNNCVKFVNSSHSSLVGLTNGC